MRKNTALIILDGFGISESETGNAVRAAKTDFIDGLFASRPNILLEAAGEAVGLPMGQMGNSEVGHLNIGAGRVVYQDLTRISKAIADGDFFENPTLLKAMENCDKKNPNEPNKPNEAEPALHIMGLVSDGGVHSSMEHLYALIKLAKKHNASKVYIHCFLDGRDTPPKSAAKYLAELERRLAEIGCGKIASICGRYYAMDRDRRWERVEKAYDMLTTPSASLRNAAEAIADAYENGETDEFVLPRKTKDFAPIESGDSIIFFNFRPDRAREITRALTEKNFDSFDRKIAPQDLTFVCMAEYDAKLSNVLVAYPPEKIKSTLGEYISSLGLKQLRIAETEKYAHVTFFFNGGVEKPNAGEDRILIPSPKDVATYDMKPEMSAPEVTEAALKEIARDYYDLTILNFANPDMVGHTGNFNATVKALEALDNCVKKLVTKLEAAGAELLITADHGNAEKMLDENGAPATAHSLNKVPLIYVGRGGKTFDPSKTADAKLADIAPTLLSIMGLEKPKEMTGRGLLTPGG